MGAYPDVASDFMRLEAELFRAARLVVDTGIHAKGWSEQQAIDYMVASGRASPDQARSEVRRTIPLPGQATGHKIGMTLLMELRDTSDRDIVPRLELKGITVPRCGAD